MNKINQKLKLLPASPGVYIMKDVHDKIIYVGKARVLKNRVRQYFQTNRNHTSKVKAMVTKIADFETIVTTNEVEALILECNLIKKYRPKYNISLKDDKSYPYLKLTLNEEFPRILLTRRVLQDGARYFGPYTSNLVVRETLDLMKKIFPLRTCNTLPKRPCLEYHINRCIAPCTKNFSHEIYIDFVRAAEKFLEGRTNSVEQELFQKMTSAAESLEFERAARFRDTLLALKKFSTRQMIITDVGDVDVLGLARFNGETCAQIFFVRDGKMIGRENFILTGAKESSDAQVMMEFIKQYYSLAQLSTTEILLPTTLRGDDLKLLRNWLGVKFFEPKRGLKKSLVDMANQNAENFLKNQRIDYKDQGVEELKKFLQLPQLPRRMECFDISHIQGSETVASMVSFLDGMPDKKNYRRFKIRTTEGKPDDFAAMREVMTRRYSSINTLPDLIIIDGGIGQLNAALEIIRQLGHSVSVIGLAKQFELIFVEGTNIPVELPRDSQALKLVQRIRDEAHRLAINYHRKLRRKRNLRSILDNISGIGQKRRTELMKHFGTITKIKAASIDELINLPSMTRNAAESLKKFFTTMENDL